MIANTLTPIYARQIETYFGTLRSVLQSDPARLGGVVQYATNPDNAEGQSIILNSSAQTFLKSAVSSANDGDHTRASALINLALEAAKGDLLSARVLSENARPLLAPGL